VKYTLQKYLSVFYLTLFIFQIALVYSSTIKNFSMDSIHALYGDDDEVHHDDLTDFETNDEGESDENNDKEENEEQDLEDDFLKQVLPSPGLLVTSCSYFEYILKPYFKRVKEQYSPPDCKV
jgi:hypothetical protein